MDGVKNLCCTSEDDFDIVAAWVADSHCRVLVCVQLDENKSAISLEVSLDNGPNVLGQWDNVILSGV